MCGAILIENQRGEWDEPANGRGMRGDDKGSGPGTNP